MSQDNYRKTIAVFVPYLSGFYFSEIIRELRREATQRHINLIVVMTNGFGSYNLPVALDHIDGVYVVLNAVSAVFVQRLLNAAIPVVSNVDNYAPLDVEVFASDHVSGTYSLFEHLWQLGHRRIGFAGDLGIVDFRIRYEALLSCYREKGLNFEPEWLLSVSEPTLPGGRQAGNIMLNRDLDCTAMICGSDLTAIGMHRVLTSAGYEIPKDLAIVSFDNSPLASTQSLRLTTVDQNISEMVSLGISRLLERMEGAPFQAKVAKCAQKLVVRESSGVSKDELSRLGSLDLDNKIRTRHLPQENSESAMALAKSGFESIVNMSNLWGPFLHWGCLAHWQRNPEGSINLSQSDPSSDLRISHFFSEDDVDSKININAGTTCSPSEFPPPHLEYADYPEHYLITLVPISAESVQWGVLAVVDNLREGMNDASYSMFNNYLDLISFFVQRDALTELMKEKEKNARDFAERLEVLANTSNDGIWTWDLHSNIVEWNNRLLEMLGFDGDDELRAYSNMPFFERIHQQDQHHVRIQLKSHFDDYAAFKVKFRLQNKEGRYLWVEASGEAIRDATGSVTRFVSSVTDITEKRKSQKKIEFMVYHDALTGLPNRGYLMEAIEQGIRHQPGKPFAVIMVDLNRFKQVNDNYGHKAGDALLIHVGRAISRALRKTDVLARFGGDEFVLKCEVRTEDEAVALGRRILSFLKEGFVFDQAELPVAASLGVAMYPRDSEDPEGLVKKSDVAMFKSKTRLLEEPVLYSDGMDVDLKEAIAMENRLRKSIEANELFIMVQPLVDPIDHRVVGGEVLARWHSRDYGLVSPARFIPLAESMGFIKAIGDWVLDQSLQLLQQWKEQGLEGFKLAINVSAGQLHHPGFAEEVIERLDQYDVDPKMVGLEVTESAAITDLQHSRTQLQLLIDHGLEISLDDFGTGYSSLSLLNELPLTWVKIDRSFVSQVQPQDLEKGMVKSLTEMCHSLGHRVVAEGVENTEQLKIVRQLGCNVIQGFIYSRPLTITDFNQVIASHYLEPQNNH